MKKILALLLITHGATAFLPSPIVRRPLVSRLDVAKDVADAATKTKETKHHKRFCIPLEEVCLDDLPKVGGKTASLGELIQQLTPLGVEVPGGFAVSSRAYDAVLDRFQLRERLQLLLKGLDGKSKL